MYVKKFNNRIGNHYVFSGKLKLQTRSDILFPSKDVVHGFMKRGLGGGLAGGIQSHMAFAIQSFFL